MLRIPATTIQALTGELLQDDSLERVAFLECSESGADLVVADYEIVPDTEMTTIDQAACKPSDDTDTAFIDRCIDRDRHPLSVHSHPFTSEAWFSSRDETKMQGEAGWIHALHDCRVLFGVLSQDELRVTEVHSDEDLSRSSVSVDIPGDWTLDDDHSVDPVSTAEDAEDDVDTELYDRSIRAIGEHGQRQLADTHVAVVGCGGIGSDLVKELAGQGVRHITFIDPDRVERSNLPRIPQATENDVGRYKVAVMQQWYVTQVPEAETSIISLPVEETGDYLSELGVDVLLAGLDRITPRVWLNKYAARHLIPYIDAGSIVDVNETGQIRSMDAQVQVIVPGTETGCFECVGRINTETVRREHLPQSVLEEEADRGYIPGTALSPEPAVNPLNSVAAAEAVDQLVRLITGYEAPGELVRYGAVEKQLEAESTHESSACYTCDRFTGTGDAGPVTDTALSEEHLDVDVDALVPTPTDTGTPNEPPPDETPRQQLYRIPDTVAAFFSHGS